MGLLYTFNRHGEVYGLVALLIPPVAWWRGIEAVDNGFKHMYGLAPEDSPEPPRVPPRRDDYRELEYWEGKR